MTQEGEVQMVRHHDNESEQINKSHKAKAYGQSWMGSMP